jgi:hypothetical protein
MMLKRRCKNVDEYFDVTTIFDSIAGIIRDGEE